MTHAADVLPSTLSQYWLAKGLLYLPIGRSGVTEEQVLSLVGVSVRSVWALELLLIMRRNRERAWSQEELIRESRSSLTAVAEALTVLSSSGIVATEDGRYRYAPAAQELEEFGGELEKLYSVKPLTVIKAIATAPQDKLQTFADAFKLRNM